MLYHIERKSYKRRRIYCFILKNILGYTNKKRSRRNVWDKQFEVIAEYCQDKHGFSVVRDTEIENSYCIFKSKEIIVQDSHKPELRFYYLLHEAGHMLVHAKNKRFMDRSDFIYSNFSLSSQTIKIIDVEEEYEAWNTGYDLATRTFGLKVNQKLYEQTKAKEISTHLIWAVEKKIKKRISEALVEADQVYDEIKKEKGIIRKGNKKKWF